VSKIDVENGIAKTVHVNGKAYEADVVVGSADYNHIEQELLPEKYKSYSKKYWKTRVLSPSSIIFYLGVDNEIPNLKHHTLLFDEDFDRHAEEIYKDPQWPERPSVYISNTSKTDSTVAPAGMENLMVLIPVAPGLEDNEETRDRYYNYIMDKLEKYTQQNIRDHVIFKRSYAHNDFENDYNAFKGNAYGLANTLRQTAFLKPKLKSKKVKNLFYAGQLTVPGPGVPPAIISGQVAASEIIKQFKN
jgi:phytoene desaturase